MNLRTCLTLLAAAACCFSGTNAINLAGKPLDLLFRVCLNQVGNEAIGRCLYKSLNAGLAVMRPMMQTGIPVGSGESVVLDPLVLDPIRDAGNIPAMWNATDIKVTGLSSVTINRVQVTESTVELEMSLGSLTAEARLSLWFLPVQPRVQFQIQRPRVLVTADWAYRGGDLIFSNSEKIVFFNEGYAVTLNGVDVPPSALSSFASGRRA